MAGPNRLPFEYLLRGGQLEFLHGTMRAQAVEQRDAELEDFLGRIAFTQWLPFPVANGFTQYDTPGPGARIPQIRRLGDEVTCRGVLKPPGAGSALAFGQLIEDWRPRTLNQSMPGNVDNTSQLLLVNNAGNIGTTGVTVTTYVFLDSLRWTIGG